MAKNSISSCFGFRFKAYHLCFLNKGWSHTLDMCMMHVYASPHACLCRTANDVDDGPKDDNDGNDKDANNDGCPLGFYYLIQQRILTTFVYFQMEMAALLETKHKTRRRK
ncbi:hypothetical protein F2Q69_00029119 [Brassica cretica]|uniref:Uncharacterized protein n=1 Tax=Brassica cretica TaxID=69181 RepID=A0A8S9RUC4_BRACR|nr:hypothetical protein F2Q69_00029119 [Brassica cretica]